MIVMILSISLNAQTDLKFQYDYSRFRYDESSSYLEIYYSFNLADLQKVQDESGMKISPQINLTLYPKGSDSVIFNQKYTISQKVTESESNNLIVGLMKIRIPFGSYKMEITGSDFDKSKTYIDEISNDYSGIKDMLYLSDIQLGSSIKNDDVDTLSLFYKNTIEIVPNPDAVYGKTMPVIYYYYEIYNLNEKSDTSAITASKRIINSRNKTVLSKERVFSRKNNSVIDYGMFNLSKLPTDSYRMDVVLGDTLTKKMIVSSKKFYLYNPDVIDTLQFRTPDKEIYKTEYALLSEEECDNMFDQAKYLVNTEEKNSYLKLTSVEAKRQFLADFWKKRDTDISTEINEFKDEYMKRLGYVNSTYSSRFHKGYNTDMGRVYLTYGPPDQIERYPNESELRPYEIWVYDSIEGGVYFIFGDITGFSKYELLSSNKRGELRDDNWARRIKMVK